MKMKNVSKTLLVSANKKSVAENSQHLLFIFDYCPCAPAFIFHAPIFRISFLWGVYISLCIQDVVILNMVFLRYVAY